MKIHNFSRHEFNKDQVKALAALFPDAELGEAETPFFTGLADFVQKVGGQTACAVLPGDILRNAWASQLRLDKAIPEGTVLIRWMTDQAARKRGRFAVRGIVVHEWQEVSILATEGGYADVWASVVMPVKTFRLEIEPTVGNDFRTGEEFVYGE